MENRSNYLSEFEREFELEDSSQMEWEADDQEYGADNEFEYEDGNESEYEDYESTDDLEWESDAGNQRTYEETNFGFDNSRDREFEDRLYRALNATADREFEMEMEVDHVLHEMEQEYFFGAIKKFAKKHGNLLKGVVGGLPLKLGSKLFSKDGLKKLRGLLKNKWVQKAAQFIPGAGPVVSQAMDIAGSLGDSETPGSVSRNEIKQAVQVAKGAYQNLAQSMTQMRPGTPPVQLAHAVKPALQKAVRDHHSAYKGKKKQVIPRVPGSIVVVHPDKIIIYA